MKQIFNVKNIVLFIVAMVFALVAALIVNQCGGDKMSAVLTSVAAGIVGTMLIGVIGTVCKWELGSSPVAGALGALIGMITVYLFL